MDMKNMKSELKNIVHCTGQNSSLSYIIILSSLLHINISPINFNKHINNIMLSHFMIREGQFYPRSFFSSINI